MTVLVTGATGSLGQAAVARLLAEGRRVAVLTRRPFGARRLFPDGVAVHEWHPISEPVPDAALDGVTAILHLAGGPLAGHPLQDREEVALASRLNASRRLIEALDGNQVRLVAASLAIGGRSPGEPIVDDPDRKPLPTREPAELDVTAWEDAIMAAAAGGASVANVRLGLLATDGAPLCELVALARRGIALDLRGALVPAIDIADAAAMVAGLLSRSDLTGLFFGVAPEPVKGEELARLLAKANRLPVRVSLPRALLRHRLGHAMALLANRRRIVPQRLTNLGAEFVAPDPLPSLERAIGELVRAQSGRSLLGGGIRALIPTRPARSA